MPYKRTGVPPHLRGFHYRNFWLMYAQVGDFRVSRGPPTVVTNQSSVLPFCPNRTEKVNQSSVSRTETEQNRTCKKHIET